MIVKVPLPEFTPDQSVNSGVLLTARNVFPAVDGYRPVQDVLAVSEAITGAFQGGVSAIASDGSAYLIAGTGSALYRLQSDGTWDAMATGVTVPKRWQFSQFGNYIVAVNGGATREVDLSSNTADEIVGAPTGSCVAVIGDFVVIGQAGGDISLVKWCAFRDHSSWTDGTNQAGSQPMLTGGAVMGIAGGEYGVILQRDRLVRMTRTGDADAPFVFDEISANFGCAGATTIAQAGRSIFFRSDRGFMALDDGQELRPIGSEKVDRSFDLQVSRADYDKIFTAIDPQNKLVFWCTPGSPGTMWIYNFELDRWTTAELSQQGIFPGFTTSVTLEELSTAYPDLDALAWSLDDPRWSGGNPRLYLFDDDGTLGTLAGDNLEARFDLGFKEYTPQRRARMRSVRPVTDAVSGLTLRIDAKARLGDAQALTVSGNLRASGVIPIRCAGRYASMSFTVAAGTAWSYFQSFEVNCEAGGTR